MKKLIYPAAVFLALNLSACGGGGGGDNNTGNDAAVGGQGQDTQKLAGTAQVIDYYGDSTIWGWDGASDQPEVQVPTPPAQIFADAVRDTGSTVNVGLGTNGQTSCQLLRGPEVTEDAPVSNPTNGKDWATLMQESKATVVILNHGINDASKENVRVSPDQYRNCLSELARIARSAGKFVIFETPNPISVPVISSADFEQQYVQTMRQVAAQQNPAIPVIDQYAYLTGLLAGQEATALMPDGIHPNQETYRLKAQHAAEEFKKISR